MDQEILNLLTETGGSLTLVKVTKGAYDTSTRSQSESTENHTVTGKIIEYHQKYKDGVLIQKHDKKALLAGKGMTVAPVPSDRIIDGSTAYYVIDVQTITKGSTVISYACQIRK